MLQRLSKKPTKQDTQPTQRRSSSSSSSSISSIGKSLKKSKIDDTLATTQLFLQGAQSALAFSPIPLIGEAVGLALTLLGTVQATKDNQSGFQQLARDACNFTSDIVKTLQSLNYDQARLPPRFLDAIKQLLSALHKIEEHATKQAKRGLAKRYLLNIADKANVVDCEKAFQNAVQKFQTISSISTWAGVETMKSEYSVPDRVFSEPAAMSHNFSVTDNSRNHTYVTGPGSVIRRSTGLQIIMSGDKGSRRGNTKQIESGRTHGDDNAQIPWTDSPRCASPTPDFQMLSWMANAQVKDYSQGHVFDTSRGGDVFLQDGVTIVARDS